MGLVWEYVARSRRVVGGGNTMADGDDSDRQEYEECVSRFDGHTNNLRFAQANIGKKIQQSF